MPDRWERAKALFHAALERDAVGRHALLDEACADEPDLRCEVESLLAAHNEADDFISSPAVLAVGTDATTSETAEPRPGLTPGSRLGPYEVLGVLGSGGMGHVYRARDIRLGREVAVKVLPAELAVDAERVRRFEQEARAASALNHPHILTVHDVGEFDSTLCIVTELIRGQTLRARLEAEPLPVAELLTLAVQLVAGLAEAHEAGIVHRDLKPENVMVTKDGLVKIVDFGLAKLRPVGERGGGTASRTGVVMGTAGYMSPEQARGEPVDHRSDQFALGAVVYEMATGRRAFGRGSTAETLAAVLHEQPEPIHSVNPQAPPALDEMVRRCLAKDPAGRYPMTRAVLDELQRLRRGIAPTVTGAGASVVLGRWRRGSWLSAGLFATALAVGSGALIWRTAAGRKGTVPAPTKPSLAVLPFQSFGGGAEDAYFGEGIAESVTTDLARSHGLLVINRNSAFQYKGPNVDVRKVGRELGVDYVLEGSVQRSAERLRVNVQLVDTATAHHRWADRYDRAMGDVFSVQNEISRSVVSALKVALKAGTNGGRGAPSLAAYDAYLQGLYEFRMDQRNMEKAIAHAERAVALDSEYALARAFLGKLYARMYFGVDSWEEPSRDWERKAILEIEKALFLDPELAEAYEARAHATWTAQSGFPHEPAVRDLRRALELSPNLATAHNWLGIIYNHVGLLDRALEHLKTAERLNPRVTAATGLTALTYLYQLRTQDALDVYERTPRAQLGDLVRPHALLYLGRVKEARALVEKGVRESLAEPATTAAATPKARRIREREWAPTLALVLARAGDRAGALREIARAEELVPLISGRGHVHHEEYFIASAYAVLGRPREAVAWLERAAREGLPCYPYFAKDPHLDGLRGDPGFQAFMEQLRSEWERHRTTL